MLRCLELAAKGKNFVLSNPMVGAILLSQEGHILAEGYHQKFGQKHAEFNVLKNIEQAPAGSCLFVNLEPCCHQGKNPPCTQIIIQKKVPRVIIGILDPNPKVAGKGILELEKHKIAVEVGVCQKECELLNKKYLTHTTQKRSFVALKIAASLDGKIALKNTKSQWITGKKAKVRTHQLRSEFEGIAVGKNTLWQDNPRLTNRNINHQLLPQPSPIIFISKGELLEHCFFLQDSRKKFLIAGKNIKKSYLQKISSQNLIIFQSSQVLPQPREVLEFLYTQKILSLIVEGGGALFTSFLVAGLVDKIYLFLAPKIIGSDGKNWCEHLNTISLLNQNHWSIAKIEHLAEDILIELYPQKYK